MDFGEFLKKTIESFFVIFTCIILAMTIFSRFINIQFLLLSDIFAVLVLSILATLAGIVLYSKREPKRLEMIIRNIVHLITILVISLSIANYIGWIFWGRPVTVINFLVLVIGIWIAVHAIMFYQSKRLTDKLNEKLRERYQGRA